MHTHPFPFSSYQISNTMDSILPLHLLTHEQNHCCWFPPTTCLKLFTQREQVGPHFFLNLHLVLPFYRTSNCKWSPFLEMAPLSPLRKNTVLVCHLFYQFSLSFIGCVSSSIHWEPNPRFSLFILYIYFKHILSELLWP